LQQATICLRLRCPIDKKRRIGNLMKRRQFLALAGATAVHSITEPLFAAKHTPADYSLCIQPLKLELAPGVQVDTISYNRQVPGPLLRLKEGVPVNIEVMNESNVPELVHWHGLKIDSINDGTMEEGSPMIPPKGKLTYRFTPTPSGTRWYHTHASAENDLSRSTYTGQFGFLYIEPKYDFGGYDQEVFLAIHHWEPSLMRMGPPMNALDVVYKYASFNDKLLSSSEPLRVRRGERVLFRLLNASATQTVELALPGHSFAVIAMDGNSVPQPRLVDSLVLGVAERVDAIVEMNTPGVWILGSVDANERKSGLGRVIEYAGRIGEPVWIESRRSLWNYLDFANTSKATNAAEEIPMVFAPVAAGSDGFQRWTVNGKSYPGISVLKVKEGKRYRLDFVNSSSELHPLHLHRHSFEVVSIAGKQCSGLIKDVVNIAPYSSMKVDFVADNRGRTLFHCHQQLHMDYGFMQLIDYQ
jgi:FtsP/CotA-like multicopper oxidase with cupredoxin domain